ncbi:MAG: hypothetical protein Q4D42_11150 [Eubacteriales bacterium]|nr:hypothetical protein [Eubacteriales bacterium]
MRNNKYWKYGCFAVAVALALYSVRIVRLDAVLRRACKESLHKSFFGQYGLYLLFLVMTAFLLFAVWQWIASKPSRKRMLQATAAAVCVYAILAHGYLDYHQEVYAQASEEEQKRYDKLYDRGLLYDLRGLVK